MVQHSGSTTTIALSSSSGLTAQTVASATKITAQQRANASSYQPPMQTMPRRNYAPSPISLVEAIMSIQRWLGPVTLKNKWSMHHELGCTIFYVGRRQHYKHVTRRFHKLGFRVKTDTINRILYLEWPHCVNCLQRGEDHSPEGKCLFASTNYSDVPCVPL